MLRQHHDAGRQCQRHRHGQTAAQTAPGEDPHRELVVAAELAEGHIGQRHADEACGEAERHRDDQQDPVLPGQIQQHQRQTDQQEQQGVEELVHQLPEVIQVMAALFGEAAVTGPVADHDAGHHHGQGAGDADHVREGETGGRDAEGQQQLQRAVIGGADHHVSDETQHGTEQDAAEGLMQEQAGNAAEGGLDAAKRHGKHGGEDDEANTVVEQRLPLDLDGDLGWCLHLLDDGQHGDGVGGGDQGTEQHAVDQRHVPTQQLGDEPEAIADEEGGEQGRQYGQNGDFPLLAAQGFQVDPETTGEQQEAQDPLQQEILEVDALHGLDGQGFQIEPAQLTEQHHQRGDQHGARSDGDGGLDLHNILIGKGDKDRQRCQEAECVVDAHSYFFLFSKQQARIPIEDGHRVLLGHMLLITHL